MNSQDIDLDHLRYKSQSVENTDVSDDFIKEHTPIVESIASQLKNQYRLPVGIEFQDLLSWGIEGLIKSYKKFDEKKELSFKHMLTIGYVVR